MATREPELVLIEEPGGCDRDGYVFVMSRLILPVIEGMRGGAEAFEAEAGGLPSARESGATISTPPGDWRSPAQRIGPGRGIGAPPARGHNEGSGI